MIAIPHYKTGERLTIRSKPWRTSSLTYIDGRVCIAKADASLHAGQHRHYDARQIGRSSIGHYFTGLIDQIIELTVDELKFITEHPWYSFLPDRAIFSDDMPIQGPRR